MKPTNHYAEDLAYIHDQGFDFLSRHAAPFLLSQLAKQDVVSGHIVGLGCGSGIAESIFAKAGFRVTGIDQSPEMLKLASRRCKSLHLLNASFVDVTIPECHAVTAFGEVFNYRFDTRANLRVLKQVFAKLFDALRPGGVLVFDLAGPTRSNRPEDKLKHFVGKDWALCLEVSKNSSSTRCTRNMTLFRKVGRNYRRSEESHQLNLYDAVTITDRLKQVGFRTRVLRQYGDLPAIQGLKIIVATKPPR